VTDLFIVAVPSSIERMLKSKDERDIRFKKKKRLKILTQELLWLSFLLPQKLPLI
jgi:hypothetical protein